MSSTNAYIVCHRFGTPRDVLVLEEKPIYQPAQQHVLVKMKLAPINPSDLIAVQGQYAHRIALPYIAGYEGVGTIVEVGEGVSPQRIGQRVLPVRGEGTWQQYVQVAAEYAQPVPDVMDDVTAAQAYINPLTAWVIIRHIWTIQSGQTVLINAAYSAIGQFFIQVCRCMNIRTIAVVRDSRHHADLSALGADWVIDSTTMPLHETLHQITQGAGVDFAIDMVGGELGTQLALSVGTHGRFMVLGLLCGQQVDWSYILQHKPSLEPSLFHLRLWNERVSAEQWQATYHTLFNFMIEHAIKLPKIGAKFALTDRGAALDAHHMTQREGKILFAF